MRNERTPQQNQSGKTKNEHKPKNNDGVSVYRLHRGAYVSARHSAQVPSLSRAVPAPQPVKCKKPRPVMLPTATARPLVSWRLSTSAMHQRLLMYAGRPQTSDSMH